jgi:hypothetical protein
VIVYGLDDRGIRDSITSMAFANRSDLPWNPPNLVRKRRVYLFLARKSPVGQGVLIHEASRSHSDAPQPVGLLWTSDMLVAETSTWQHTTLTTNIDAPGGIRTHNLSRGAATDLRLRRRGNWDRPKEEVPGAFTGIKAAGARSCQFLSIQKIKNWK